MLCKIERPTRINDKISGDEFAYQFSFTSPHYFCSNKSNK